MTDLALPTGRLVSSRVVSDIRTVLSDALDRDLTGYAVVELREPLSDSPGKGVFTFERGIPVLAYHTGTDRGGPSALSVLAAVGPYRLDLYALSPNQLETIHEAVELRVPPELPAERLAGDPALAVRTREQWDTETENDRWRWNESTGCDAVVAFLDDTEQIEAIREQARAEAKRNANEWGLDTQLTESARDR